MTHARLVRPQTAISRAILTAGLVVVSAASLAACAPIADQGCSADEDCDRGEVCEMATSECIAATVDTTSTENPAMASFAGKPVPMFRGTVCMPHEVKSGEKVPVSIQPCFHPCLQQGKFHHQHYYYCEGSRCNAWAVLYVEASSIPAGCPADAFGQFDRAMCTGLSSPIDIEIATTLESGPVKGSMTFEIPYLSNADMAEIAGKFDDSAFIQSKIDKYPRADNRVVGGRDISLLPSNPVPPASCVGNPDCPCYDVGF